MKTIFEYHEEEKVLDIYTRDGGRVTQQDVIEIKELKEYKVDDDMLDIIEIILDNYISEENLKEEDIEKIGMNNLYLNRLFQEISGEIENFANYNKIEEKLTKNLDDIEFDYYYSHEFQEVTFSIYYFEEIQQEQRLYYWNLEEKNGTIIFDVLDKNSRDNLEKIFTNIDERLSKYEENYRPTHANKINLNSYIKRGLGDFVESEEVNLVKDRVLLVLNAEAWQDIPYEKLRKSMHVVDESIRAVKSFRTKAQINMFEEER